MDAGLEEGSGRRRVGVVRRDDRDGVDAVSAALLALRHCGGVGIDPGGIEQEILARKAPALGIGGERAGDELPAVVQPRGDAVHRPDEGAASTADHAEAQAAAELRAHGALDRHGSLLQRSNPSMRRLAAAFVPPAAKSSKARSVTRMMWAAMNSAPSRAPSSGALRAHSHSSTARES